MLVIATKKKVVETVKTGDNGKEIESSKYPENLAQVPCIQYLITFQKKSVPMSVLFDSSGEFNTIYPTFA